MAEGFLILCCIGNVRHNEVVLGGEQGTLDRCDKKVVVLQAR